MVFRRLKFSCIFRKRYHSQSDGCLDPGSVMPLIDFRSGNGMWCKFWFQEHVGWDQILFFYLLSLKLYIDYTYNYIYYTYIYIIFMKGSSFGCVYKRKETPLLLFASDLRQTTSISVRNSREPEVKNERFNIDYPYSFTAFRKIGHVRAGCMFFPVHSSW